MRTDYPELKNAAGKLKAFTDMIEELRRRLLESWSCRSSMMYVCERHAAMLRALREKNDMESRGRLENVQELQSSILGYLENAEGRADALRLPG